MDAWNRQYIADMGTMAIMLDRKQLTHDEADIMMNQRRVELENLRNASYAEQQAAQAQYSAALLALGAGITQANQYRQVAPIPGPVINCQSMRYGDLTNTRCQ